MSGFSLSKPAITDFMLGSHDHTVISVRVSWLAPQAAALAAIMPAQQTATSRFTSFSLTPAPLILCCDVLIRNTFRVYVRMMGTQSRYGRDLPKI